MWAREASKLSIEEAAHKLGISDSKKTSAAEKLEVYENGEKEPSRSLLIRMSKQYHQSLLVFYLDRPPRIGDRGEDFRTLPEDILHIDNANVDVLFRDIKARQMTVRETLIDADEGVRLDYVGKHNAKDGIDKVVETISETIKLDIEEYRCKPTHKEAFKLLREHTEMAGVFVILKGNLGSYHSNIDVNVFRGFALSDDIAPFIVINDLDAESAWSFTLLHELAHILLGETGISGGFAEKEIEKYCNDIASEFLLPKNEFAELDLSGLDTDTIKEAISDYALSKKLSSSHISYRLLLRGDISKKLWVELRDYYRKKWIDSRNILKKKNSKTDGGPNYYIVKNYKLGSLVKLVKRLTYDGSLTTTKAGMLLDVKPLKVHRLFE